MADEWVCVVCENSRVTNPTDGDTLPHVVSKDGYFYDLSPSRTNYSHTKTHPVCKSFHAAPPHTYLSLSCQIIRLRGVLNHLAHRDKSPRANALVGHRGAVKKKNQCFYWPWLAVRPCPVLYDSASLSCHPWCVSDCAVTDRAHWPIKRWDKGAYIMRFTIAYYVSWVSGGKTANTLVWVLQRSRNESFHENIW